MATGRIVGRCTKMVDGIECGGTLRENYKEKEKGKRSGSFVVYNDLIGYICDKCGDEQPLADPLELGRSLSR